MKQKAYKEATDQPDKAHNIIIYAGDSHSQLYRKFLKEVLDFDKIEVAGKEEPYGRAGELMYCIDMEPITQPLFSKYHEINKSKDTATDEIKPLVAKQQDKRDAPMKFSPFEPDDIILSDRIVGGASHEPVWNGSLRGNPVIYKLMNKSEYNILMKVQGNGVVRVLYKIENYELPEGVGVLVAMEKLDTIKLHPDYNTGSALDTKYSLEERVKKGVLLNMHSFDFNNLRRLLNTIVEINNMGILWGDLKQENMGLDNDGNLRIFDFSESRTIRSDFENKHLEIIAYGKLLYNIITQNFAFHPGRHYRGGRTLSSDEFLQVIDMIQDIDSISKNALQKCFLLNNESTDNDISESIKELYRMLDFNQNKFK
jgi:serine/threonine protein kinase